MLGLLPEHTEIVTPRRGKRVPETVLEELARLKALYNGFGIANWPGFSGTRCDERIDDKTVKKLWQQSPCQCKGSCPWATITASRTAIKAASRSSNSIIKGGRSAVSVAFCTSRVRRWIVWIRRFEAEHFAGLMDKSRAPQVPARRSGYRSWSRCITSKSAIPMPGGFRIWSLLARDGYLRAHGRTDDGPQPAGL